MRRKRDQRSEWRWQSRAPGTTGQASMIGISDAVPEEPVSTSFERCQLRTCELSPKHTLMLKSKYRIQSDVFLVFYFLPLSPFFLHFYPGPRHYATSRVGVDQDYPLGVTAERDQSRERLHGD